jgi:hypothetical protein
MKKLNINNISSTVFLYTIFLCVGILAYKFAIFQESSNNGPVYIANFPAVYITALPE